MTHTHTQISLWLQDADATWRLASRIFQGLRGVMNWRLPVPLTSNQMQSRYFSPVSFESSEVFPCFSIIHIHHLFTIYSPSFFASIFPSSNRLIKLPIPVRPRRPRRPSRGWAAEDAFLRAGLLPSECIAGEGCSSPGSPTLTFGSSAIYPCSDD